MSAFPSSAEPTKGYASHEEACPVVQIKTIGTEQRNPNTLEIDRADTAEILRLMNEEDKKVAPAVEQVLPQVEKAVDVIYAHMRCGGRLHLLPGAEPPAAWACWTHRNARRPSAWSRGWCAV